MTDLIHPHSMLDVGCGNGSWMAAYAREGVKEWLGVDGPQAAEALKVPLDRFVAYDLVRPLDLGRRFDLVQSLEVAEHLPADAAGEFVRTLIWHGDVVLFSAAIPFQGGVGHVNERWPDYWAELFDEAGFACYDWLRPQVWADDRVAWWYAQNSLLFVRRDFAPDWLSKLPAPATLGPGLRLVHPSRYLALCAPTQSAAYSPVAFNPSGSRAIVAEQPTDAPAGTSDVAVVIPTIGRPTLARAIRSVYAQQFTGTIQILIGVDAWRGDRAVLADVIAAAPPNCAVQVLDLGYSTAARNGGLYPAGTGGALRTILTYAAHSRLVAYLDDDNWWGPDHLATLVRTVTDHDWAYSLRWFADAETAEPLCVDAWESVGPGAGVFNDSFGGFVDPSCLLIDKVACEPALRLWCQPLPTDGSGMSSDRTVFEFLRNQKRGAGTGRATAFYTLNPSDANHARRLKRIAQARAGGAATTPPQGPSGTLVEPPSTPGGLQPSDFPSPVVVAEIDGPTGRHLIHIPERETWLISQLFEQQKYGGAPVERLNDPPVVLDVGANVGVFTLYAKLCYHDEAVVHAFEPYPAAVELFRRNLAGYRDVTVRAVGLGRSDGTVELLRDSQWAVSNSTRPDLVPNPAGRVSVTIRDAGAVWDELALTEVDVLKVDAEGAEVEILEALGPRLAGVRVVLAEYHTGEDRRRIDALLPGHVLFGATTNSARQGVVKYMRADLVQ